MVSLHMPLCYIWLLCISFDGLVVVVGESDLYRAPYNGISVRVVTLRLSNRLYIKHHS